MKNILARANRGVGVTNQIITILDEICYGPYHFEVAVMLRNALLISSMLCNSEAWYNVTNEERNKLEQVDEALLRRILECPSTTPKEMLYLELNCLPIRFIIIGRRVNFLSCILREDKSSLIFRFLQTQLKKPNKDDWGQTVTRDLELLGIEMSDITKKSAEAFKKVVNEKVKKAALKYLNEEKSKHTKVLHIVHNEMKMQEYFSPNVITIQEAKFLFLIRCRMLEVRNNFSGSYSDLKCPLCRLCEDSQKHLLECSKLAEEGELVTKIPEYDDLFSGNLMQKVEVARTIIAKYKMRRKLLKEEKEGKK